MRMNAASTLVFRAVHLAGPSGTNPTASGRLFPVLFFSCLSSSFYTPSLTFSVHLPLFPPSVLWKFKAENSKRRFDIWRDSSRSRHIVKPLSGNVNGNSWNRDNSISPLSGSSVVFLPLEVDWIFVNAYRNQEPISIHCLLSTVLSLA